MTTKDQKCRIILDSCCDLPADLVESLDVELISLTYMMEDGERLDDLWTSMTPHEFYGRMRKGEQVTTSQVPHGVFYEVFKKAAEAGVPTVYICFSSGLSGTYAGAVSVWNDLKSNYPDFELYIVDSKLACTAEGMLAMEAVRQRDRGLTAFELAEWAKEARYYVHGYFTLDGLETLHRGGRIPDVAAIAGAKLDIRPILSFDLDGRLSFFGAARGRKKSIKQLLQIFEDRFEDDVTRTVIVASADAVKEQNALAEQLLEMPHKLSVWQTTVGPVIGAHVGQDMVAIGFWGPDRRQHMSLTGRIAKAVSGRRQNTGETEEA